jgi:photosynthetic reaction center H subunit
VPAYSNAPAAASSTPNPLLSNMGPASYADRKDEPDLTVHGTPKIVPLRADPDFYLDPRDPDYRGMPVVGMDLVPAGTVREVWVDRAEPQARYLEVTVAANGRNVLLPVTNVRLNRSRGFLAVKSITGAQFADVPGTKSPDLVTLLEEDQIQAYFAGGYLFAHPNRAEPLV